MTARGRRARKAFIAVALVAALALFALRYGNEILIALETDAPSQSVGTRDDGRLIHGKRFPSRGSHFVTYSYLGSLLGRNGVHDRVRIAMLNAYGKLAKEMPEVTFVVGETGWIGGGPFRPHRTHQNGLSVDFMIPVRTLQGQPAVLPTWPWKKFGYGVEFDRQGRSKDLQIDFEAIAAHLYWLASRAQEQSLAIHLVIFAPELQPMLFATRYGPELPKLMRFSPKPAWVRHDEHYHVDFRLLE